MSQFGLRYTDPPNRRTVVFRDRQHLLYSAPESLLKWGAEQVKDRWTPKQNLPKQEFRTHYAACPNPGGFRSFQPRDSETNAFFGPSRHYWTPTQFHSANEELNEKFRLPRDQQKAYAFGLF